MSCERVTSLLTQGSRRTYAVLSEHVNPFNHAMQMPGVRGMIDMTTDAGCAMAQSAAPDHAAIE